MTEDSMTMMERVREMMARMRGQRSGTRRQRPGIRKKTSYERGTRRTGYERKILNWQAREMTSLGMQEIKTFQEGAYDFDKIRKAHDWVLRNIKWNSDQVVYGRTDFWAISDRVIKLKTDDCDGQAVAMWRKMLDAGLPGLEIGMAILIGNGQGHMTGSYQIDDDFWVLDNGYMTSQIVKASELFANKKRCKGMKPVAGFNLHQFWSY